MATSCKSSGALLVCAALLSACEPPTESTVPRIGHAVSSLSSCTPVPIGLVSWWPGAIDGRDVQGSNHGSLRGGIVAGALAFVGGGFALDGDDDFVEVTNDASLNLTQALTLMAWVNVDHFDTFEPTQNVIGKGNFGGNGDESYALIVNQDRTAAIQLNHGRYPGRIDLNRLEISTGGTGRLNAGQWHFIAGTFDKISGTVTMFLDGVLKGHLLVWSDVQVMGGLWSTSQPVLLGKTDRAGSPYPTSTFSGLIDEAQIYNRALTAAEILAIYEAGPAGLCSAATEGPPTARISDVGIWAEGEAVQFDGSSSSTDPVGGPLTYSWDFGDGSTGSGIAAAHVYGDNGPYEVRLTVTTQSGLQKATSLSVTGTNVPPQLDAITAPLAPQPVNTGVVDVSAPFSDPGLHDSHSVEINWDADAGGAVTAGSATSGVAQGTHAYSTPGVYAVRVRVSDDDGGEDNETFRYVVVYDPEAGFVSGGGTFDSPAGAFVASPTVTGRAHFAFVSRYKKGATVPSGSTQFRFQTAAIDFSSTSYEWLVVAGAKATYKGTGRINSGGDYGFLLSAIDGALPGGGGSDRIRIKIWDRASGEVVYDNLIGEGEDAPPATVITGGSIIIHK